MSVPCNYRPISNLNCISKVLERLFLSRFQAHILASPNFNQYQSAYRPGCSTETALQLLLGRIYSESDEGKPTLLISLDLSSAFDVIDHVILLKRLSHSFGVTGTAYFWIQSYLCGRTQSVRIGRHLSASTPCSVGVLQGSVLGPLLFLIYTSPIAQAHHIEQQQCNTLMTRNSICRYVAPTSYSKHVNSLQQCLASLHIWFCENGMALNRSKSVAIISGTSQRVKFYTCKRIWHSHSTVR